MVIVSPDFFSIFLPVFHKKYTILVSYFSYLQLRHLFRLFHSFILSLHPWNILENILENIFFLRKFRRGKIAAESRAEATIFLFFDLRRFRSRFSHAPPHFVAMWKLLDGRRVDVFTSLNHNVHVKISCFLRNDLKYQH